MRLLITVAALGLAASSVPAQNGASRFECTQQQAGVGALRTASGRPACAPAPASLPAVRIVGAADPSLCGQCLRIAAPERAMTAFVIGTDPAGREHQTGDLVVDRATAAALGLTVDTPLSWVTIPCPFEASIAVDVEIVVGRLHVEVRGASTGIATAWIERAAGPLPLERGLGNDFELAAPGPAPWRLVLEDIHGRRLDLGPLRPGRAQPTGVQFAPCALLFTDGFEGGDLSSWGRQTGP